VSTVLKADQSSWSGLWSRPGERNRADTIVYRDTLSVGKKELQRGNRRVLRVVQIVEVGDVRGDVKYIFK